MESNTITSTWSLYRSIKELPFGNFKTCLLDKDLTALIISGEVPHETLERTWDEIQEEFSLQIGGDVKTNIRKIMLVETLNSRITRLTTTLLLFIKEPIEELVEVFNKEGWNYPTEDLRHYVQCVRNEISTLQLKFENEKKKLEKDPPEEQTHETYADLMAEICKREGRQIPDSITTFEFCRYYNRLLKHFENLKRGNRANR